MRADYYSKYSGDSHSDVSTKWISIGVKYSQGLRYSQRWCAFHIAILQSSHRRDSLVFRPGKSILEDPWSKRSDHLGRKLVLTIDVADIIDPISIDPIPEFVKMTVPLIPKHLFQRFKDLLGAFMRPDGLGEQALVNGTFYYGDMEVNHLLLVRRLPEFLGKSSSAEVEYEGSLMYTW